MDETPHPICAWKGLLHGGCGQTSSTGTSLSKGAVVELLERELGPLAKASPFPEEGTETRVW